MRKNNKFTSKKDERVPTATVVEEVLPEPEKTSLNKPVRDEKGRLTPGHTANPNGRPPGSISITDLMKAELQKVAPGTTNKDKKTFMVLLLERMLDKAINKGDQQMMKLIWNYIDGLPKGSFDVTSLGEKLEGVVILPAKKQK